MPFVSDKQRRYLWSQKPEVAKKFAEHHEDGGRVGRRRRRRKPRSQERLDEIQRQTGQVLDMLPGIGDARSLGRAADAFGQGDYGTAALEAGLTGLGYIPVAGPLARGAIRGAKNADLAATAIRHADPEYAKMFGQELLGRQGPLAKSVGASARFGEPYNVNPYVPSHAETPKRWGLPDTPEGRKSAKVIAEDMTRLAEDPSIPSLPGTQDHVLTDFVPASHQGEARDLVVWDRPDVATWNEKTGGLPYPSKQPSVTATPPRDDPFSSKRNLFSAMDDTMFPDNINADPRTVGQIRKELGRGSKTSGVLPDLAPLGSKDAQFVGALRDRGVSTKEIADRLGVSESEAKKFIKAKGLRRGGPIGG